MLNQELTLKEMIEYKPNDMDMASLPLDIVVYVKVSVISLDKNDNYDFITYLCTDEDVQASFKEIEDTVFYDFDGTHTDQEKYINIFEMFSLYNYEITSALLKEILEAYTHEADVIIDLYTHDSKEYRLSNLDGIVKLEEMHSTKAA